MTTLKAAVVPAKVLKNGKHRIRIAIGHKQETRYIVTRFEIDNTANFKGGQVVGVPDAAHVNAKLRGILNSYQDALDKINTSSYTCTQLVEYLSSVKQGAISYSVASADYMQNLIKEGRRTTASLYQRASDYFIEFVKYDIMLDGITPRTIKDFDIYLKNVRRLAPVTCGMHMAHLKAIINQAIRDKKVSYDTHPFEYYERPAGMPKERDISVADVKKIRDAEIKEKSQRVARDVFMLSYYLGGINLMDLMQYNFKDAKIMEYVREKSKNTKRSADIVQMVVAMADKLGMPVIAEGVETKEQADFLGRIGCDIIQGYYYAKPMSMEEFEQLLNKYPYRDIVQKGIGNDI